MGLTLKPSVAKARLMRTGDDLQHKREAVKLNSLMARASGELIDKNHLCIKF